MATTTTYAAIRDNYTTLLEALTPSALPAHGFRRSPVNRRIRAWATGGVGSGALRRFEFVRDGLIADPVVMDPTAVERNEDVILTVAYPYDPALYGRSDIDDIETIMRADARIIRDLLFSSSSYLPGHSAGFVQLELTDRADQRCWYNVFRISLIYTEAQSLRVAEVAVDGTEALYRSQLMDHFFGSQTLPTLTPEAYEPDYAPVYPFNTYSINSPNLLRIDRITHRVDDDIVVYAYHYVNTSGSKKLAISHEGHSYFNLPNHATHIQYLLNLGWNVVLVQMPTLFSAVHPPNDPDPNAIVGHQVWAAPREVSDPGYVRTFLLPTLYAKGHLKSAYGYDTFVMTGLSGGGWTTNIIAALDQEIRASWCVSGSLPWDLRPSDLSRGDYEQFAKSGYGSATQTPTVARPFFAFLPDDYKDLYAMGATDGRFAKQVYIENEDPAYFSSTGLHAEIDAAIAECDGRVSGTVAVTYDTTQTTHEISNYTAGVIESDLESLGISAVGPSGLTVIEPTITNMIARYRGDQMTAGQLTDLSGNGNHAVQATAANQGSIETDAYIQQPVLRLVAGGGGNDYYRCNTVLVGGNPPSAFTEYSMLVVYQPDDSNANQYLFTATDSSGTAQTGPHMFNTSTSSGTLWFAVNTTGQATRNVLTRRWVWALGIHTAAERKLYVNGVLVTTTSSASGTPAIARLGVGLSNDASPFWPFTGRMAEMWLAGSALTSAQISAVKAYINARYGL